jgi:hypothetical protein
VPASFHAFEPSNRAVIVADVHWADDESLDAIPCPRAAGRPARSRCLCFEDLLEPSQIGLETADDSDDHRGD